MIDLSPLFKEITLPFSSTKPVNIYHLTLLIIKNSSLLSKFLNDKKSRILCNFKNSLTSQLQTLRQLLGSFYLIFYLKFPFVTHLFLNNLYRFSNSTEILSP
ncbi:hypothetical protein C4N17_07105 [Fusobacterium periodonticum]|uniref:PIN family toxin-antitoxin system n=1 Tax=Fusobacterium periodonticum TaxID=860 RepID=A0AAD0HUW8_9FUSO|nr:hypothetical protein C4N17_07105 [Fusobacterium periodonticum]